MDGAPNPACRDFFRVVHSDDKGTAFLAYMQAKPYFLLTFLHRGVTYCLSSSETQRPTVLKIVGLCVAFFALSNHVCSEVGLESSGDSDTFLCLVVLEEGSDDTREGEGRAVERVAERYFLVLCAAVAAVQAVRLIGVEVRGRRHFQPAVLRLGIDLNVVAEGSGEGHVSAAETPHAVGQFAFL